MPVRTVAGEWRFSGGSDSGSLMSVSTNATSDSTAAPYATRAKPVLSSGCAPANMPPMAGPRMNPMPNAEPRRPSALGRVASVVMSVV